MLFRGVGLVGGSLRGRVREGNRGRGIEGVREGRDDGCAQCAAVGVSKSSGMSLRARMHTHTDARHYPVQRRAPVLVFSVHLLRLRALGHARGRRQRAPRATRARARESPTSGSSCFNFSTSPSRAASICATCADFARTGEKKEKMFVGVRAKFVGFCGMLSRQGIQKAVGWEGHTTADAVYIPARP